MGARLFLFAGGFCGGWAGASATTLIARKLAEGAGNDMPKAIINGVSLHYHSAGRGVPIVFIHPPVVSGNVFTYQRVQLADSFRVIVFDVRGHGESGESPAPVTNKLIAEDARQLLDHLGIERAFVCGYSTGGQAALEAMLLAPQRFIGGILVSTMPAVRDWRTALEIRTGLFGSHYLQGLLRRAIAWGNADAPQTYKQLMEGARKGDMRHFADYFKASLAYDATPRLASIRQPVLLLYGENNKTFYPYARMMHSRLPNSTLVFLKGTSHRIPTMAPARMNGLIQCWIQDRLNVQPSADTEGAMSLPKHFELGASEPELTL